MRYLLSLSLLLLFSCSSVKNQADAKKEKPARLNGTSWTLSSFPNFKMEKLKSTATLIFNDTTNRIGGYSGCNGYGGSYEVNGTSLKMKDILGTLKACMPGMKTESTLYNALNNTDNYKISDGKLVLMQGTKVLAEFVPLKKEEK
ncbi:META domain-containing protein [Taibaiella lutea]|uniref:META domain-containing protein n=1 Tax=Taibaiella lutea TaxID=2608001 RepID=A0A5M6CFL6_9BACT|nr:META domain-containing protein [Taibaiella lutea]KAA5533240.1 META domain-containing protein [Taibaiella lutea]